MPAVPIPIPNPLVIAWARQEGGFDLERVAKKAGTTQEQVKLWEEGEKSPTLRQLGLIASLYQRPFSLFFQPTLPKMSPLAAEYRRLVGVIPGAESPELRLAIRHMLSRRESMLGLLDELDLTLPEFSTTATLDDDPIEVATRIRSTLQITGNSQSTWSDGYAAWRGWRTSLENAGIAVFMFPKVSLTEARGIALLRKPLPVVAVNTKEGIDSRPFTAIHELVHVMLANGHEESAALSDKHSAFDWEKIERFAESVASFTLIEKNLLDAHVARFGAVMTIESIRAQARRFNVTPSAYATRLWRSGFITGSTYNQWKSDWDQFVSSLKKKEGFATPVDKAIGRGGRLFSELVLEAFDLNRITFLEASRYLNLRTEQFNNLRVRLVQGEYSE